MAATNVQVFIKELARTGHPLLHGIVAFNARLAERIATPWGEKAALLAGVPAGLLPARSSFAALRLGAVMPLIFGESVRSWVLDFRQPSRRIALLPPALLVRLGHWYGLAAFRQEVGRLISREEVLALQAQVGEEGYYFALHRAELLTGNRVPVPHIPASAFPTQGQSTLLEKIERVGRQVVLTCILGMCSEAPLEAAPLERDGGMSDATTGISLCARLAPTLPFDFLEPLPGAVLPPVLTVWPIVRKLIIKEIAPSWAPFFT